MVKKITKKEYLEEVINLGARRLGFVPLSIQTDKVFLKAVLQHDPEVLLFLPEKNITDEIFWNTNEKKRYLLLKFDIAKKMPGKMIEWMIDEKSSLVGMEFFKEEFPQFKDLTESAKIKLGLSFLIEGRVPPAYVSNYIASFTFKTKEDLKISKRSLILKEQIGKILNEELGDVYNDESLSQSVNSYKL